MKRKALDLLSESIGFSPMHGYKYKTGVKCKIMFRAERRPTMVVKGGKLEKTIGSCSEAARLAMDFSMVTP